MNHWAAALLAGVVLSAAAQTPGSSRFNTNFEEEAPWQEQQDILPPAFPRPENLREFYVSAVATNTYLIDVSTLAAGADGVVRYVIVVQTSGGARNVSFEGIHCKERRWKHYATGHADGTWAKSRPSSIDWRPIENKPVNRHHAALSRDYFCPMGNPIGSADDGRNALRLGKHPDSN